MATLCYAFGFRQLQSAAREDDTISRYGYREILLLMAMANASDVALHATMLVAAIAVTRCIGGIKLDLSASLGMAVYPQDGDDIAALDDRAEIAMVHAKRCGSGGFQFHSQMLAGAPETRAATLDTLPLTYRDVFQIPPKNRLDDLRNANEPGFLAVHSREDARSRWYRPWYWYWYWYWVIRR